MKDIVTYLPPLGYPGGLANRFIIRKKFIEIFSFRKEALVKIFGDPST